MTEKKLVNYSIIFMGLALCAYVLQLFENVMRPFAIALILIFITTPLSEFSKKKGIPPWITFTVLTILIISLIALISSFVKFDNLELAQTLPEYQNKITKGSESILNFFSEFGIGLDIISAQDIGKIVASGATAGLGAIQTFISETLLAIILLMFIVQSRSNLFKSYQRKYGTEELNRIQKTLNKIQSDIISYFSTKSFISFGTATFSLFVLLLFGAQFISLSVFLIFILNFIPIVGSLIAVVTIIILYIVTYGFSLNIVWLSLLLAGIQIVFGNILEPKLTGKKLNLSPILILISLYIWGWIWGIVGMFLSVPLTLMILIFKKHFEQDQSS